MSTPSLLPVRWLPTPAPIQARFSSQLDCFRWFAALMVCVTHVRSAVLVDYNPLVHSGWWARIFYGLHGFGHEAVIIFFVLSGYLVGGEVVRAFQRGDFNWRLYLVRRVCRLYAVYLAALALGGLLDQVGLRFFRDTGIYTQSVGFPMLYYNVSERLGLTTLLGNILFCQEILVPSFGSNVPLWSLANEAWYYLLFPLTLLVLFGRGRTGPKLASLGLILAAGWFMVGNILWYFSVWLIGLLPHFLRAPVFRRAWLPALGVAGIATAIRFRALPELPVIAGHWGLALAFALLLNSLTFGAGPALPLAALHKSLAGFSYSLYLCHWPFTLWVVAGLQHCFGYGLRLGFSGMNVLF